MTATFTYVPNWNAAYIASPADTDEEAQGASQLRNLKGGVEERLTIDHSWNGDGNDGKHQWATLRASGQTTAYALDAGDGRVWAAQVSGNTELFYQDSGGNVIQLTQTGQVKVPAQQWTAGAVSGLAGTLAIGPGGILYDNPPNEWTAGPVSNINGGSVSGGTLTINFPTYTWPNGHTFQSGITASDGSGTATINFSPSFAGTPAFFAQIIGQTGSSTANAAVGGTISSSSAVVYTYGIATGEVLLTGPLAFNWFAIY